MSWGFFLSVRVDIISCKKLKIDDLILLTEAFSTFQYPFFLSFISAVEKGNSCCFYTNVVKYIHFSHCYYHHLHGDSYFVRNVPYQQTILYYALTTSQYTHCSGFRYGYEPPFLSCFNLLIITCIFIIGFDFDLGGHTAEMLNLLSVLQIDHFSPRFYIAAATDNMSLEKARVFENSLVDKVDFRVTRIW